MVLTRWNRIIKWVLLGLCCLAFCILRPSGAYAQQNTSYDSRPLLEVNLPSVPADDTPIAIVGGRLIDGRGGDPVEDAVVVVEGNRVVDVGPRTKVEIPDHADRLDASGKTLMPGLIDAHFHSLMDNDRINRYLHRGITTMRDPGHPLRFYQSLYFAEKPVPRMFLTGGHLEGFPPVWKSQAVVVRNQMHARQAVYDHVDNGATGIKLYFKLPLDYYEVITDAASKRNVPGAPGWMQMMPSWRDSRGSST